MRNYQEQDGQASDLLPADQAIKTTYDDIFQAAAAGCDHDIDLFIQQGVAVNALHPVHSTTALAFAAQKSKIQTCQLLISKYHADPNLGCLSPLDIAIMEGAYDCAKYLLDKTTLKPEALSLATLIVNERPAAEIFSESQAHNEQVAAQIAYWRQWPLLRSAYERQIFIDINVVDQEGPLAGATLLWIAVACGQWDLVKMMVERGRDPNINAAPAGEDAGLTVLYFAAATQQWDVVKLMLKHGKDPNINVTVQVGPGAGATPLWYAAMGQQWDVVKIMLEQCKDPNINAAPIAGDNVGATVLWLVAFRHQWDLVKLMLERCKYPNINAAPQVGPYAGVTVLSAACEIVEQADLVKLMLERCEDPDINAVSYSGESRGATPLLLVVASEQWDLAMLMLERCKDPNINATFQQGKASGVTVLACAAIRLKWDVVRMMLARSKDPNINAAIHDGDMSDCTVFCIAVSEAEWDVVKIMLERGKELNINTRVRSRHWVLRALVDSPENLQIIIDHYPHLLEQSLCPISEILQRLYKKYHSGTRPIDRVGIECMYHALTVLNNPAHHLGDLSAIDYSNDNEGISTEYVNLLGLHVILNELDQLQRRMMALISLFKDATALPLEIIYMIAIFIYRAHKGCHTIPPSTLLCAMKKFPDDNHVSLFVSTFRRTCGSMIAPALAKRESIDLHRIAQEAISTVAKNSNRPLFFSNTERSYICKAIKELEPEQFNGETLGGIIEQSFHGEGLIESQCVNKKISLSDDLKKYLGDMAIKIADAFVAEKGHLIAPHFATPEGRKYLYQCVYLSLYHLAANGELLEQELKVHAEKFIANISRCDQLNHKSIAQSYFDTCRVEDPREESVAMLSAQAPSF